MDPVYQFIQVFGDTYFYNRVGVAIFVLTAHGKYMIGGWGGGVGWGGVGWDNNVHARLRNYVMLRWWNVLARWQLYVVTAPGKYMIGGVGWGGIITSMHACGTMWCYKLIVVGNISKKCPSQMKNRTGPTINARFWDRIYQWIYRHNMSEWDIASSCEMKKRLCKLFVVSWRNC